jgi:hypothetical protein
MMSAPELTRRARLLRPLTQLSLLVLITLALVWGVNSFAIKTRSCARLLTFPLTCKGWNCCWSNQR